MSNHLETNIVNILVLSIQNKTVNAKFDRPQVMKLEGIGKLITVNSKEFTPVLTSLKFFKQVNYCLNV